MNLHPIPFKKESAGSVSPTPGPFNVQRGLIGGGNFGAQKHLTGSLILQPSWHVKCKPLTLVRSPQGIPVKAHDLDLAGETCIS